MSVACAGEEIGRWPHGQQQSVPCAWVKSAGLLVEHPPKNWFTVVLRPHPNVWQPAPPLGQTSIDPLVQVVELIATVTLQLVLGPET